MKNNYICHTPYLRNSVAYDYDHVNLCKIMIFLGIFFIFLKFSFFGQVRGKRAKSKRAKKAQNNK